MADYNSRYSGAQIDEAVGRAVSGGSIDQSLAGKAPAVESKDYPGCYYRTVGGVVEWLNPPMQAGEEYRTTERFLEKPVYIKVLYVKAFAAAGSTLNIEYAATGVVDYTVDVGGHDRYHSQSLRNPNMATLAANRTMIMITSVHRDMGSGSGHVWIKYTKLAD